MLLAAKANCGSHGDLGAFLPWSRKADTHSTRHGAPFFLPLRGLDLCRLILIYSRSISLRCLKPPALAGFTGLRLQSRRLESGMQTGTTETIEWLGNCFPNAALKCGTRGCGIRERGQVSPCGRGLGRSPGKQSSCSPSPEPPPALFIWAAFYMRLMSVGSCVPQKGPENLDLSPALFCCEATAQPSFLSQPGARLPAQDGR